MVAFEQTPSPHTETRVPEQTITNQATTVKTVDILGLGLPGTPESAD